MTAPDGMRFGRVRDAAPYDGAYKKAAVRHPHRGGDGGLRAYALGIAPSADGAMDDREFRAVRGAGVSLAAASGSFARCDGRPEALPLDSAIF